MWLAFADDSKQPDPTRCGMGPLVATGAVLVDADKAHVLERALDRACLDMGCPSRLDELKWSPRRNTWLLRLDPDTRAELYQNVLGILTDSGALALLVVEDEQYRTANKDSPNHEHDATTMLLERIANRLRSANETGLLVADRPGGTRKDESAFVADCLHTIEHGTLFVKPDEIAMVITGDSRTIRLLQAADLVTSALTAYVAGEPKYAPQVAEAIKPLLPRELERTGGVGVKLHPDAVYANLYHWLFDDPHFVRYSSGVNLPHRRFRYAQSPNDP